MQFVLELRYIGISLALFRESPETLMYDYYRIYLHLWKWSFNDRYSREVTTGKLVKGFLGRFV